MRYNYPFIIQTTLLATRGYFQCHALLPSSKVPRASTISSLSRSFKHVNDQRRVRIQRNLSTDDDLNYDAWDEEASEAILSGQGDFFNFRGGDDNGTNKKSQLQSIKEGYKQRIAADPSFLSKSVLEIILAASTQYMAEVSRRGKLRMLPEIDFVFAGVLTAVCGKYYSMWRVARTVNVNAGSTADGVEEDATSDTNWRDRIPTNAFQPTLLDGCTTPSLTSRFLAFLLPMPQLFRAGVIASTIGYGLTWLLIQIRTLTIPQYVVATKPVSVPLVAIYTGVFMAFVSNIRYQLLQGIVEPCMIDGVFSKIEMLGSNKEWGGILGKLKFLKNFKRLVIVLVRWANGLLGSWIAIGGMRALGLQKLK